MAMWITKQRAINGPVFGSADKFEGLGIFFDTYKNNRPGTIFPYVMAMLGIIAWKDILRGDSILMPVCLSR